MANDPESSTGRQHVSGRALILNPERLKVTIEELKALHSAPPWDEIIVQTDRYIITAICQAPGHRNDWHYHLADECWTVYEGELSWTMEGRSEPIHAGPGDWIFAPANTFHLIQVHGDRPAIRFGIIYTGEFHRRERSDMPPAPHGAGSN
jgi:quercetin dioxygenase-like cupin family protein